MKRILVIGAGKSTGVLIEYLLAQADQHDWAVTVCDRDVDLATERVGGHARGEALELDSEDESRRDELIEKSDLVVSMLPAFMHPPVARACVQYRKHFVSASYVSPEIRELDEVADRAGITLLNEVGVDPGIDHMSAMRGLDDLRDRGAKIVRFETFTRRPRRAGVGRQPLELQVHLEPAERRAGRPGRREVQAQGPTQIHPVPQAVSAL